MTQLNIKKSSVNDFWQTKSRFYIRRKVPPTGCTVTRRISRLAAETLNLKSVKPTTRPTCKRVKKTKVPESKKTKVPESKKTKVPESKKTKVLESKKTKVPESKKTKVPERKKRKTPEPKFKPDKRQKIPKSNTDSIKAKSIKKMQTLRGIYNSGYEFPSWVIPTVSKHFDVLMKPATVYYTKGANLSTVKKLALKREPVNITTNQYYNRGKLAKEFGWSDGYYKSYYSQNLKLAPNIAVYTPTFVDMTVNGKRSMSTKIHIINSIGYAFDSKRQPDYSYLMQKADIRKELINSYVEIFKKIYACAKDIKADTVVMSLVGANNFAKLYMEKGKKLGPTGFQRNVWVPAFQKVYNTTKDQVKTVFMGSYGTTALNLLNETDEFFDIGYFPDAIAEVNPRKTLFVNAWDPISVPGNGNKQDNSLDGYIGRLTNIAVNGTSMTNPYLKFKQV